MSAEADGLKLREQVGVWMLDWWGERCPNVEPTCCLCQAWHAFDHLFANIDSDEMKAVAKFGRNPTPIKGE